jgi:hypothetical protein
VNLFNQEMEKIKETSPELRAYLGDIPAEKWAFLSLRRPQFGHLISNI